jgi:hypothetical protein
LLFADGPVVERLRLLCGTARAKQDGMNPVEFREFIAAQWAATAVHPPWTSEMHPGGPAGLWVTLGLVAPDGPRAWLHFRMPVNDIEMALSDGTEPKGPLKWETVHLSCVPRILREFAVYSEAPANQLLPKRNRPGSAGAPNL